MNELPALKRAEFSPPAWGWSGVPSGFTGEPSVLPTRVGMVRQTARPALARNRSPHPRGDGPGNPRKNCFRRSFSPPAWGWSEILERGIVEGAVLPTRVGMVRVQGTRTGDRESSPHPRGDGPQPHKAKRTPLKFSPPAWGWSVGIVHGTRRVPVLPTRVGMVRCAVWVYW